MDTRRRGIAVDRRARWLIPAGAWMLMAFVTSRVQDVSYRVTRDHVPFRWTMLVDGGFTRLGKVAWDSGFYLAIAEEGYVTGQDREAAFPGYALAIRAARNLTGDAQLAAMWISAASGLAAALLFWSWLELRQRPFSERLVAFGLFLLYPYGFLMFGVVYSDSFLLASVLAALLLVERQHYLAAGLAGALATFTRPNSLILVGALLLLALERSGVLLVPAPRAGTSWSPRRLGRNGWTFLRNLRIDRDRFEPRIALVLVSLAGVGAYSVWLAARSGDPFYFWTVQRAYGHRPLTDPLTWIKANVFLLHGIVNQPIDVVNEIVSFGLLVGTTLVTPTVGRRFGWGYALLLFGLVVTTWGTAQWFAPSGRYLLPAVPVLAALAAPWLVRRRLVAGVVLAIFAASSLALAAGFAGAFDINW